MKTLFASMYEWFGTYLFYSKDMGDHLNGMDITCTDFIGTPWYMITGFVMLFITILVYSFQYHIYDNSGFNKKHHLWIMLVVNFLINFLIAMLLSMNSMKEGFCQELSISIADCIGFGISNALWSLILHVLITSLKVFRRLSTNCRNTTFWKP